MNQQQRPQTIIEKMTDTWYNLRYILMSYLLSSDSKLKKQTIYILGQQIQINEDKIDEQIAKLKAIVKSTIWMTYRKNFNPLLGTNYISDTGWGCMVRAGQMAIAQAIKKHLKHFGDKRDQQMDNIIQAFVDNDDGEVQLLDYYYKQKESKKLNTEPKQSNKEPIKIICPFSIQKIAYQAKKDFTINPGEWYKPNYILYILETLHNNFPIKGSEELSLLVFNDSSLFMDQIIQKMYQTEETLTLEDIENKMPINKNSVGFYVLTRIGLEEPNINYLKVLDQIMELPSFQGVVGGSPQRALFILGRIDDQYIYLDPHYVQEATTRESVILDSVTFSCPNLLLINQKQVDTSMGIQFYVRNTIELLQFWKDISRIKKENEHFFIYLAENTPAYLNNEQFVCQEQQQTNDEIMIID